MGINKKRAFITGITGQDGLYLAEFLLGKGYEVHGLVRRSSSSNLGRIIHLLGQIKIHEGDLSDGLSLKRCLEQAMPHEVYNLAAMSHVKVSFAIPEYTANIDGIGALRLLEAIRNTDPSVRFYQASTSELFGKVCETPQTEKTQFYPRSPYGIAKLYAYWAVVNYREAYNIFACNGILFNHESPHRGETFVSRKITMGVVRIIKGMQDRLVLGNLDAKRDWGYAKDFVEGMWLILQQSEPLDLVLATGKTTTVRRFVELSFQYVGMQIEWVGAGIDEKGIDPKTGKVLVEVSAEYFRPAEVDFLLGDSSKARQVLGWEARTTVEELVTIMMKADSDALDRAMCEQIL